jgi:hypothetical protein
MVMFNSLSQKACAIIACLTLCQVPAAQAQSSQSDELKAAIIYNILRFVEFPPGSAGNSLQLCVKRGVSGDDQLSLLQGKSAGVRRISVRFIDSGRGAENCNIVYLGRTDAGEIARSRGAGVLTIGDGASFLKSGGIVGLVTTGKQTRFEVSMPAAKQSGLSISSKLLRLASRVVQ